MKIVFGLFSARKKLRSGYHVYTHTRTYTDESENFCFFVSMFKSNYFENDAAWGLLLLVLFDSLSGHYIVIIIEKGIRPPPSSSNVRFIRVLPIVVFFQTMSYFVDHSIYIKCTATNNFGSTSHWSIKAKQRETLDEREIFDNQQQQKYYTIASLRVNQSCWTTVKWEKKERNIYLR